MAEPSTNIVDVASKHTNRLFDAVALLDAAAERIEAATPSTKVDERGADSMHNTLRLVQMAKEVVQAAADDLYDVDERSWGQTQA